MFWNGSGIPNYCVFEGVLELCVFDVGRLLTWSPNNNGEICAGWTYVNSEIILQWPPDHVHNHTLYQISPALCDTNSYYRQWWDLLLLRTRRTNHSVGYHSHNDQHLYRRAPQNVRWKHENWSEMRCQFHWMIVAPACLSSVNPVDGMTTKVRLVTLRSFVNLDRGGSILVVRKV